LDHRLHAFLDRSIKVFCIEHLRFLRAKLRPISTIPDLLLSLPHSSFILYLSMQPTSSSSISQSASSQPRRSSPLHVWIPSPPSFLPPSLPSSSQGHNPIILLKRASLHCIVPDSCMINSKPWNLSIYIWNKASYPNHSIIIIIINNNNNNNNVNIITMNNSTATQPARLAQELSTFANMRPLPLTSFSAGQALVLPANIAKGKHRYMQSNTKKPKP
jgi:hypothetical protein